MGAFLQPRSRTHRKRHCGPKFSRLLLPVELKDIQDATTGNTIVIRYSPNPPFTTCTPPLTNSSSKANPSMRGFHAGVDGDVGSFDVAGGRIFRPAEADRGHRQRDGCHPSQGLAMEAIAERVGVAQLGGVGV